jgi:hypothetical protein
MSINRIYRRAIIIFIAIALFGAVVIYSIWFSNFNLNVVISGMILIIVGFIMWKRLYPKQSLD